MVDRIASLELPVPKNTVPTTTSQTKKTEDGKNTKNNHQRPQQDISRDYKDMIVDRVRDIVVIAFKTVPGLDKVAISVFQPTVHRTMGHHYQRCILSVVVDRTTWGRIIHTNVTSENALANFDFRFRYDKSYEFQEVSPVTSPGDTRSANGSRVLHDMDPIEFEVLVKDLLTKMGFQTSMTKITGDGGIDIDAYNPEPIVGGKVVVQCKRYAGTIGSPVIRDLYGAMTSVRASKGILITTSDFSVEARRFAEDKPLELINGRQLVQLLNRHGFDTADVS